MLRHHADGVSVDLEPGEQRFPKPSTNVVSASLKPTRCTPIPNSHIDWIWRTMSSGRTVTGRRRLADRKIQ
jgi:hypothetical protein